MIANGVEPFTIAIDDSVVDGLRRRLVETRWPDSETVDDWSQGARSDNVRALCDYWGGTMTGGVVKPG